MWIEIGLAIAIPSTGAAFAVARYFWKKEQCFIQMKNKIDELSKHDEGSIEEHDGYEERLNIIEQRQQKNEIYLKLILNKLEIPFND